MCTLETAFSFVICLVFIGCKVNHKIGIKAELEIMLPLISLSLRRKKKNVVQNCIFWDVTMCNVVDKKLSHCLHLQNEPG
jgi:hypothetical protein